MVFAPTRDISVGQHEPAAAPKRREHIQAPTHTENGGRRLQWRAVVHAADKEAVRTTWHIAGCTAPLDAAAHCPEGQRLIESAGDPDGHCLIDAACARCDETAP